MLDRSLAVKVFIRDGFKCRHCGFRQTLDPHHIIFKSHGGKDTTENLITLCRSCHSGIHAGNLEIVGNDANKEIKFIRKQGWQPK